MWINVAKGDMNDRFQNKMPIEYEPQKFVSSKVINKDREAIKEARERVLRVSCNLDRFCITSDTMNVCHKLYLQLICIFCFRRKIDSNVYVLTVKIW